MPEQLKLTCPHCGKQLEIPAGLEEFSCLYCGERLQTARVLHPVSADDYEAERKYLAEHLPKAVTDYPDYFRHVTRADFAPSFEKYEQENAELLAHIDRCASSAPEGSEAAIGTICEELLDALEAHMQRDKRWNRKSQRMQVMFEVKSVLAIFLTPTVRKLKLEHAETFRTELNRRWLARYPKERWMPGDYEAMMAGFRRKRFCYITTATCRHEGKPDDCAELTAFRAFRDGWLSDCTDGAALIERYYAEAPGIVACIDYCDAPDERYAEIRTRWLEPCYRDLQAGRMEACRARYAEMVQTLHERYFRA